MTLPSGVSNILSDIYSTPASQPSTEWVSDTFFPTALAHFEQDNAEALRLHISTHDSKI